MYVVKELLEQVVARDTEEVVLVSSLVMVCKSEFQTNGQRLLTGRGIYEFVFLNSDTVNLLLQAMVGETEDLILLFLQECLIVGGWVVAA